MNGHADFGHDVQKRQNVFDHYLLWVSLDA